MGIVSGIRYLRSFPEPLPGMGEGLPQRWAEYALPMWGMCVGLIVATLDHGLGYLFQNPLISSALTVALLAAASRRVYPIHFARSSEAWARKEAQASEGWDAAWYAGIAVLVMLLLLKVMAFNALWLTIRWPVLALIPLASRWGIVMSMNLLPCGRSDDTARRLSHRRAIGPTVWATSVFAGVPLAYVYLSTKGFPLGNLSLEVAARIWLATSVVAVISGVRSFVRLRGWTAPRMGALSELVEVAVPLAVIMVIPR